MYSCYPSSFVETPSYETPSLLPLGYCYALATDCIHVFYLPIYYENMFLLHFGGEFPSAKLGSVLFLLLCTILTSTRRLPPTQCPSDRCSLGHSQGLLQYLNNLEVAYLGSILQPCHCLPVILLDSALRKKASSAALVLLMEGLGIWVWGCQIAWNTLRYVLQALIHHASLYTPLAFSQGATSTNSSTGSLAVSLAGKYSRVCYGYHTNLTKINMPPTRALPTILMLRMVFVHLDMPHF
jgi:hypothetical protein